MKTIHMLDDNDVRKEVEHVLSCCYEGDEWMEDGSIRQSIRDLQRLTDNHISVLANQQNDVDGLRATIQELVTVTKKHDVKLLAIATSLDTVNQMLKILSKQVGLQDESE